MPRVRSGGQVGSTAADPGPESPQPCQACLAVVGADLVGEEPAGLTEEETIISMAGLILKWCEMNYGGKHPGHKPIEALAKRLYRRAVSRGLA